MRGGSVGKDARRPPGFYCIVDCILTRWRSPRPFAVAGRRRVLPAQTPIRRSADPAVRGKRTGSYTPTGARVDSPAEKPEGSLVIDSPQGHIPVLKCEVVQFLHARPGDVVVDATIGLGGHARLFADAIGSTGTLVGLDVDPANLEVARSWLAQFTGRLELVHANFAELPAVLASLGIGSADVLLADLGICSTQLDDPGRGFSFQQDGALDMRLDPRLKTTAGELVNRLPERELGDLLYRYSQEPGSRRIAKSICQARRDGRITTTSRLAKIVLDALGVTGESWASRVHPATRAFLALRIAVNDELQNLASLLEAAPAILTPGGRFGVIAFHSLEDKPVKLDFRRRKNEGVYAIVTKKPVVAGEDERRENPRSRSAKLRVAQRLASGACQPPSTSAGGDSGLDEDD